MASATEPKTLQEAILYFSDADNCLNYMVSRRWPNGVTCPTCGSSEVRFLANQRRWECKAKHAKKQFSAKVGTIFEDSPISLEKWLSAVWIITAAKNGVSSWEIHRSLGITQKTAWFMLHRIRLGMQSKDGGKLSGEVEVDETFIGAKARNMHADKRAEKIMGRGPEGKAIVAAVLERDGKVRAKVVTNRRKKALQSIPQSMVDSIYVLGSPDRIAKRLYEFEAAGITTSTLQFTSFAPDHNERRARILKAIETLASNW